MSRIVMLCVGIVLSLRVGRALAAEPVPVVEQNWPQWRGPLQNGVAPKGNPPTTWAENRNVRWKIKLPGSGTGTPVVSGDKIFLQTAIPTDKVGTPPQHASSPNIPSAMAGMFAAQPGNLYQFVLMCIDRPSGKVLWQKVAREAVPHERHHKDHGYASYSPVTDGKCVLASFGSRGLYCFDLDGNLKWQKDFGLMQTKMTFGEGSSPALSGQTAIINWDHEGDDFIVAMDVQSGKELWRRAREEDTSWSTPLIVKHQGTMQVIVAATRRIRSYDLAGGKLLWECGGMTANVIPTPVASDGIVYAMSGFRGSALLAIRLGQTGDLTGTDAIAWSLRKSTPYVPSPLLYGQRLYFFSGNNGVLSCFHTSGRPLIENQRIEELQGVYASPVGAGGRVYLVGRNGVTVVIKDADAFEVLATNRLDERFDASPAVVGHDLLLRGHEHLYCISEK